MQNTIHHGAALPTGNWLAQEMQRLGKTRAEVARAVQGHSASIKSMQQNNRVLPPGWYPALRALGIQFQEAPWPTQSVVYTGTDLSRDLRTCAGLQYSRYWFSKQLCVAESDVAEVIRSSLPVPQSWLLKLAELGANVPVQVRTALHNPSSALPNPGPGVAPRMPLGVSIGLPAEATPASAAAASPYLGGITPGQSAFAQNEPLTLLYPMGNSSARGRAVPMDGTKPRATVAPDSVPTGAVAPTGPARENPPGSAAPPALQTETGKPLDDSFRRERFAIFFHLTDEDGLYFSLSVPPSQAEFMQQAVAAIRAAADSLSSAAGRSAG